MVPRFETRYLKDSLAHRGSVLWNMVTFKEHNIPHLSKKDLNHRIRSRDYVRENLISMQLPPQLCAAETLTLYIIDFYSRLICKYVSFILLLYFIYC